MTSEWTPRQQPRANAVLSRALVRPVLAIGCLDDAEPLARALVDAGLSVLEVTAAHRDRARGNPPHRRRGARGLRRGQYRAQCTDLAAVTAAAAAFAIYPSATEALYASAREATIPPWLPAIATASELMRGQHHRQAPPS